MRDFVMLSADLIQADLGPFEDVQPPRVAGSRIGALL
jgi:hypothetical protein